MKYAHLSMSEHRPQQQGKEENKRLKQLAADLPLNKRLLAKLRILDLDVAPA